MRSLSTLQFSYTHTHTHTSMSSASQPTRTPPFLSNKFGVCVSALTHFCCCVIAPPPPPPPAQPTDPTQPRPNPRQHFQLTYVHIYSIHHRTANNSPLNYYTQPICIDMYGLYKIYQAAWHDGIYDDDDVMIIAALR